MFARTNVKTMFQDTIINILHIIVALLYYTAATALNQRQAACKIMY